MTQRDAVRLADQATFGGTEALLGADALARRRGLGAERSSAAAVRATAAATATRVHTDVQAVFFCDRAPYAGENCWRDWFSTTPLVWDFYRNATTQPDQLRQRVAFALQQIVVVSGLEVSGTYGHRNYQNMLLDNAFGNYRQVLKKVALSPVMGDFLNNANNDKAAPNENFARELLQLFSIGTCEFNADGSLRGGNCMPTYNNEMVRNYAFALTGWTYPAGGRATWGCCPQGTNCQYYGGDMTPLPARHDASARPLLSGVEQGRQHQRRRRLGARARQPDQPPQRRALHRQATDPVPGLEQPVAGLCAARRRGVCQRQLRQRRAQLRRRPARRPGRHRGRRAARRRSARRQHAVGQRRPAARPGAALHAPCCAPSTAATDGDALSWWWGDMMRQHIFRAPSVFNFYAPDYPVPGTSLVGPAFGIHNANTALGRLNFLVYLFDWNGSAPAAGIPNAVGTRVKDRRLHRRCARRRQARRSPLQPGARRAAAGRAARRGDPRRRSVDGADRSADLAGCGACTPRPT